MAILLFKFEVTWVTRPGENNQQNKEPYEKTQQFYLKKLAVSFCLWGMQDSMKSWNVLFSPCISFSYVEKVGHACVPLSSRSNLYNLSQNTDMLNGASCRLLSIQRFQLRIQGRFCSFFFISCIHELYCPELSFQSYHSLKIAMKSNTYIGYEW